MVFSIESNYKASFAKAVDLLTTQQMPVQWRVKAVDDLIEAYVKQVGEVPNDRQLERLTNYILRDSKNQPDKVSKTEYPELNEAQWKVRSNREIPLEQVGNFSVETKRVGVRFKHRDKCRRTA
ncbi:hypothetical protein H1S01_18865 [Heliobacterium chlorum]|uniref:Uncharacterized protein n=1 Tax=Heliobacterium chlorum TaxID=2698 RepID=A0ABR7T8Z0_HELCL|nr:hypothetical protein [Heliobacterium chlorum]MBC9786520.1 hypothetical protein [Heliobacterium chlorum]